MTFTDRHRTDDPPATGACRECGALGGRHGRNCKLRPAGREAALRARTEAATPGPWYDGGGEAEGDLNVWDSDGVPSRAVAHDIFNNADRAFIAHAREDVPYLLDALAAARRELAAKDEALRDAVQAALADRKVCPMCLVSYLPDGFRHEDSCPAALTPEEPTP